MKMSKTVQLTSGIHPKTSCSLRYSKSKLKVGRKSRNIPKRKVTQIYAEQLAPLYSDIKMYQIKAALTLTDNNMHECRLILDMKKKISALKKQFLMSTVKKEYFPSEKPQNRGIQYQKTSNVESEKSSSLSKSLNLSPAGPKSTVYDFIDSSEEKEPLGKYVSLRKPKESQGPSKDGEKVGVLIVRCAKGYKALPL